jgi:plastocyanin/mono/diheme cytochrome c family protein
MEMSRRSAGLWAGAIITATVVAMVALAIFGVVSWGVATGLIAAVVFTLALLYIFFGRLNNVQKTGYASLLGVVLIALFIPLFWLNQNSSQASFQASAYTLTLQRGAALYGTYCLTCHGSTGQGYSAPQLNGGADVSKLTDDDLTRIISAGVPLSTAPNALGQQGLAMPAWSELYGGPLTSDDISYLVALIRSSDPTYLKNNHITDMTNGFNYVYGQLTTQAQIDNYNKYKANVGNYGPQVDMTNTKQVKMDIVNGGPAGWGFQYTNIKIKVGTTVTWTNVSNAPHTVTSGLPGSPDGKFDSSKSGTDLLPNNQGAASVYSYTFNTPGTYPYYCVIHLGMVAQITVVA